MRTKHVKVKPLGRFWSRKGASKGEKSNPQNPRGAPRRGRRTPAHHTGYRQAQDHNTHHFSSSWALRRLLDGDAFSELIIFKLTRMT